MFIPGFLLIGVGVGMLLGQPYPGALIGLGLGFLVEGIKKWAKKSK